MYTISKHNLISFPILTHFIYFSSVISLVRTSSRVLSWSGNMGHACFVLSFKGCFQVFTSEYEVSQGNLVISFFRLSQFPSTSNF